MMSDAPQMCMFDNRAFNLVIDRPFPVAQLKGRVAAYATHIQHDEINNTKDKVRKEKLLEVFREVVTESVLTDSTILGISRSVVARLGGEHIIPTESAVWGVSRWGESKWTASDNLYVPIKAELDKMNKGKANNVQDALIAETAIKKGYVLVRDDAHMIEVAMRHGGKCMFLENLQANDKAAI